MEEHQKQHRSLVLKPACFPSGEFVRGEQKIKQLDWLAINNDGITIQSHSLVACLQNSLEVLLRYLPLHLSSAY
jgi:hypothetical protein